MPRKHFLSYIRFALKCVVLSIYIYIFLRARIVNTQLYIALTSFSKYPSHKLINFNAITHLYGFAHWRTRRSECDVRQSNTYRTSFANAIRIFCLLYVQRTYIHSVRITLGWISARKWAKGWKYNGKIGDG